MNVNVKVSITDEMRRTIHENFYGKKGMISRKDVSTICQTAITDLLMGKQIGDKIADAMKESISFPPVRLTDEDIDELEPGEIEYMIEQNRLLTSRMNRLQHMIDTRGLKK